MCSCFILFFFFFFNDTATTEIYTLSLHDALPILPLGADPDGVGTTRMHTDPGDLVSVLEPHMRPRPSAVGGLPNAVAVGHVAADGVLARADVHHIGVRLAHADRPDRAAEVLVRHRQPGVAAVCRLEDPAARGPHPILVGPRRRAGDGHRAATAEDADLAPLEGGEYRRVVRGGLSPRGEIGRAHV